MSTLAWNIVESIVAILAGLVASSVALISFGIDASVEMISALVVTWRLWRELRDGSGEEIEVLERRSARIAGSLLFVLAIYIAIDAGRRLAGFGEEAHASAAGIALVSVSLLIMPLLGWAKLRTANALESAAMRADAFETISCAWLSLTTLTGLLLNATFGWYWADPLAALLILPLVVREGIEGWKSGGSHRP